MISDKRLAANRANGALSRGPKTPEGKARSAQNACKHGLLSSIAAIRAEKKEAFDDCLNSYCARFQPADDVELGLVEEMVAASWHLRRSLAIETSMLDTEMAHCPGTDPLENLARAFGDLACTPKLHLLYRYQTRLHNMHSRALREFLLLRKSLPPAESSVPETAPEPNDPGPSDSLSPNSPVPNEPKTPFVCNKSNPTVPSSEPAPSVSASDIVNTVRRTVSMLRTSAFALLFAAASVALAQEAPKQLTARELFYAATTPKPAATTPPKTTTAAPKLPASRSHHTTPKPVEIASETRAPVIPTAVQTAPMPSNGQQPLGLRINVLRYNSDGTTTDVLPNATFHSGDRIRVAVEPNAPGFLYIANQGASGFWKPLFPSSEIENGDNRVEAMHSIVVPSGRQVFTFDATTGRENLFVVFSRRAVTDFEEMIYSLRKKQPASEPAPRPDKNLIMATNIGDPAISRLRASVSRDLIIETVDAPTSDAAKKDTALYVVNRTGDPDSPVTADITLGHE
jgi:hypothetical protein